MESILTYGGAAIGIFVFLALLGFIGLKFYTLSTKETAFVRTGVGGQMVVLDGGAFVVPGIHEIIKVNMKTLRLEVDKQGLESLITADRLRVDVKVEFFVRVKADAASVADAATTLGKITMEPDALKNQVEAKFVDALRAVAVKMSMYDLNAKRSEFVQQVQTVVAEDIAKNGLELESVSLTALNQTKKDFFDPSNAFDAEGLLVLTRETEARRKLVNDIEQETSVAIATKDLSATREQQELRKQTEEVKLNADREIANLTADQRAAIAAREAAARREAETATITANREVETNRIEAGRVTREAQVQADALVTMRNQETDILVANKSKDVAAAEAEASTARALAVKAEEGVETTRQVEVAERRKAVTLVSAEEKARESSIAIVVASEAEKDAAVNRASAARTDAEGQRDASVLRAAGTLAEGEAAAKALLANNQSLNALSAEQVGMQIRLAVIAALPELVEKAVKPLHSIDSIRIAEVGGLNNAYPGANGTGAMTASSGSTVDGGTGTSLTDQVVNGALRHRAHAPLVDGLMREVGLAGGGDMTKLLTGVAAMGMAGSAITNAPAAELPASAAIEAAQPDAAAQPSSDQPD